MGLGIRLCDCWVNTWLKERMNKYMCCNRTVIDGVVNGAGVDGGVEDDSEEVNVVEDDCVVSDIGVDDDGLKVDCIKV